MYKFLIFVLLLPCLAYGQSKKMPLKKKKTTQAKHTRKTTRQSTPVETDVTIPPPIAEPVNEEKNTLQLVKPSSYKAAVLQAAEKQVGLLLFIPGNTPAADSTLNSYAEELFIQGANAYRRKFLVYMAWGNELAAEKSISPLLYPAYYFFSADGMLLGKKEGLKGDVYEIEALQQQLQDVFESRELWQLQQQYQQQTTDSATLAKLVRLTATYNANASASPATPDQYQLLDILISKYAVGKKVDSVLIKLVDHVYNDNGYVHEIKLPETFSWLVEHYTPETDPDFKWYAALSNHINEKYTALINIEGQVQDGNPDLPAQSANAAKSKKEQTLLLTDSLLQQHASFLPHLRNVQLLNEAVKLAQVYYDLTTKKQVPAAYTGAYTLPFMHWLYDSLLHANAGLAATQLVLKDVQERMSAAELRYVDDYYTDFTHFETGFKKDLGLLLNNTSWMVFKEDMHNRYLPQLLAWSKTSLEIEKNNPYYLDTYAQLLYAGGDKKTAAEYEQKAINVLKLDKNFREEKWMIPFMEKVLAKMKAGAAIGREDYTANE